MTYKCPIAQYQKMEKYVSETINEIKDGGVSVSFFVTGKDAGSEGMESKSGSDDDLVDDMKEKSLSEALPANWHTGRPKLLDIIRERSQTWEGRVAVTSEFR